MDEKQFTNQKFFHLSVAVHWHASALALISPQISPKWLAWDRGLNEHNNGLVCFKNQKGTRRWLWISWTQIPVKNALDNANVVNGTRPPIPPLPEADESDMEFFIEQLKLILPVLGFDFLRQPASVAHADSKAGNIPTECSTSPLFRLTSKKHGVEAQARERDGEFVVLGDSTAVAGCKSLNLNWLNILTYCNN